jgi:ribosomal protein S18 acetylase RimI-like enzyme
VGQEQIDPVTPRQFHLRNGLEADCAVAGRLHAEQIPTGFLSLLGPGFLDRLYRRVVRWPGGLLVVATEQRSGQPQRDDPVVGFVACASPTSGLYREFLRHDALTAGFSVIGPLARNWKRALETLRHGSSDSTGVGQGSELLAIAVDPSCQGHGIGRQLVEAFLAEVCRRGDTAAYTVTSTDNEASMALYRACGFSVAQEFELHPGTTSVVMQWRRTDGFPSEVSPA